MAAIRGEVPLRVEDGPLKGDYTLLLDFNALCDLEDTVPGLMDGTAVLTKPSAIRAVFHGMFAAHHPEVKLKDAGTIVQTIGIDVAGAKVQEASQASFGTAEGGDSDRPQSAGPGSVP